MRAYLTARKRLLRDAGRADAAEPGRGDGEPAMAPGSSVAAVGAAAPAMARGIRAVERTGRAWW